jgi:hypothetical protein
MKWISTFLCFAFLNACSTFEALKSPSAEYRDYVESSLLSKELYDSGRQMIVLKVLEGNQRLKDLQEGLAPGFGFEKKEEVYQLIVALSLSHPGAFSKSDLKIHLYEYEVLQVKEVSGAALLETFYFFAYPYHRVFVMDFPKEAAGAGTKTLRIRTPRGELSLPLDGSRDGA